MDKKWLDFAGLMHQCIYNLELAECPYNQIRKMDQLVKLEKLLTITNEEAKLMQKQCNCLRSQCYKKVDFSLKNLALLKQNEMEAALSV